MVVAEGAMELLPFLFRRLDISAIAAGTAATQPQEVERMDDDEAQALAEAMKALTGGAGLTPHQLQALNGMVLVVVQLALQMWSAAKAHPAEG
jgi:hypothetical protein